MSEHNLLMDRNHPIWSIAMVAVVGVVLALQAKDFDYEWFVLAALGGSELARRVLPAKKE